MTDNEKLFLQLMEQAQPHVRLATECLLYTAPEGKAEGEREHFFPYLLMHTAAEYEAAIAHLQECCGADAGRHRAWYEETISFIRHDLMRA